MDFNKLEPVYIKFTQYMNIRALRNWLRLLQICTLLGEIVDPKSQQGASLTMRMRRGVGRFAMQAWLQQGPLRLRRG